MAYQLILNQDVIGLGIVGEVVNVADGYARNYLLPEGLAEPFSTAAETRLAEKRQAREAELEKEVAAAEAQAEVLRDNTFTIAAKVVEDDKLYGSVGTAEIAEAIAKLGQKLDKDQILLDSPIKELGDLNVAIRLHPQVSVTVTVNVVAED